MTWTPAGPYTAAQLEPTTRVRTPQGDGSVAYVRMDHLGDITKVAAVSVVLDARRTMMNYSGTIVGAHDVEIIE